MDVQPAVLQQEATMRYLTDPEFHARVNIVLQLNGWTSQRETGLQLSDAGVSWTRQAAAYALVVAEIELDSEFVGEAVESMKATAEQMGFSVVERSEPEA